MNARQQPAVWGVERDSGRGAIIGLDVGERRIGVALASADAKLAGPYCTLPHDAGVWDALAAIVESQHVACIVVGLPRNLAGDDTPQTVYVRDFVSQLVQRLALPVALQDEALTSRKAEEELQARGKPYAKGDIDALAATYILEDYLKDTQS